jgi:hypothetical protein
MSRQKPIKMLSQQEEKELLRSGEDVLRSDFPNPERLGCPGTDILRTLASRSQSLILRDRNRYLDHMTCCSPCFSEFSAFVDQARHRKRLAVVALCAALLLTLGLTAWLTLRRWQTKPGDSITHKPPSIEPEKKPQEAKTPEPRPEDQRQEIVRQQPEPQVYRDVVLDVRDQSVARGESPNPAREYPTIPRGLLNLSIYLPFGSEAGKYHLAISRDPSKPLLSTTSTAIIKKGITVLEIRIDTNGLTQGEHTLETKRNGWSAGYKYLFRIAG